MSGCGVVFMNDTSPEIARMVRERYAQMEPILRFQIGVSAFETARATVISSFPPGLCPLERRRRLCEQLYSELPADAYETGDGEK